MSFWSNRALEPKRQFRFRVEIEGFKEATSGSNGATQFVWYAKKATKPSFTVGEIKANFVDKSFYYPGRVEWNTCEVVMYDPVNPNVVNAFATMFGNSGYFIPNDGNSEAMFGSTAKSQITSGSSVGDVKIITIDESGGELESWKLNNAWIKSMKFGDVSYDSDDFVEVTVEFRYDWASLYSSGAAGMDDSGNWFTATGSSA